MILFYESGASTAQFTLVQDDATGTVTSSGGAIVMGGKTSDGESSLGMYGAPYTGAVGQIIYFQMYYDSLSSSDTSDNRGGFTLAKNTGLNANFGTYLRCVGSATWGSLHLYASNSNAHAANVNSTLLFHTLATGWYDFKFETLDADGNWALSYKASSGTPPGNINFGASWTSIVNTRYTITSTNVALDNRLQFTLDTKDVGVKFAAIYVTDDGDPSPPDPTNLATDASEDTRIHLTWDASVGASQYSIYLDGAGSPIVSGSLDPTDYWLDQGLAAGTTYSIVVTGTHISASVEYESGPSNTLVASTTGSSGGGDGEDSFLLILA